MRAIITLTGAMFLLSLCGLNIALVTFHHGGTLNIIAAVCAGGIGVALAFRGFEP